MIQLNSYVIMNADERPKNITNKTVISFGMNPRATITASSIRDDSVTVCVQRAFTNIAGAEVEPQEISLPMAKTIDETLKQATVNLIAGGTFG